MATVLDRPPEVALKPRAARDLDHHRRRERAGLMQWVVAALLVGAGMVHLVMAPAHLAESTVEGVGFLVAGWLQLALAVVVVLRPSRWVAIAVIVVSVACLAAWAVSRTTGFPFGAHAGHAESVTTVDGLTVLMEYLRDRGRGGGPLFAIGAQGAVGVLRVQCRAARARRHDDRHRLT